MKSRFDLKHDIVNVKPENLDDLWILKEIITAGSLVTAKTERSIEVIRGDEKVKVGRKPVTLTINVEKMEWDNKLRVGGKITEAPEDIERGYHAIDIQPNDEIKIVKQWKKWEIEKIKSMERASEPILICILDDTEADFYILRDKATHLLHISSPGIGKESSVSKKPEYYGNIFSQLDSHRNDSKKIVLAGPAFTKEEIMNEIKQKDKELTAKIIVDSISHTGEVGLQELLNRKVMEKVAKFSRIAEETATVEKVMVEIARESKATYGTEKVKEALEAGAAELLIVSDEKVRELEELLELCDKTKCRFMIISSKHQSGEKLLGIGGIAVLLRFKMY